MSGEGYPMVATHDPRLIAIAEDRARWFDRSGGEYEFQLLYGVRPEEQARPGRRRAPRSRLRAVRRPVVRLPHAPAPRAPGERCVLRPCAGVPEVIVRE